MLCQAFATRAQHIKVVWEGNKKNKWFIPGRISCTLGDISITIVSTVALRHKFLVIYTLGLHYKAQYVSFEVIPLK